MCRKEYLCNQGYWKKVAVFMLKCWKKVAKGVYKYWKKVAVIMPESLKKVARLCLKERLSIS